MNPFSMTSGLFLRRAVSQFAVALTFVVAVVSVPVFAQGVSSKSKAMADESSSATPKLIQPEELARILQAPKGDKPLIFHVGYRVLYQQAHVPRAEYIGPASEPNGIQVLRQRAPVVLRGFTRAVCIAIGSFRTRS